MPGILVVLLSHSVASSIALFFAIFMIANVIMKKRKMNAAYIAPQGVSYEIDITCLIISIVLIVIGAGALSID